VSVSGEGNNDLQRFEIVLHPKNWIDE